MRKVIQTTIFLVTLFLSFQGFAKCLTKHYGPTVANERLWRIVLDICPDPNVIPQQVMLAILKSNPTAFNHANVNGLKSGYVLRIPSSEVIKRISPEKAIMLVSQQNRDWEKGTFHSEMALTKIYDSKPVKHHKVRPKSSIVVADTEPKSKKLVAKKPAKELATKKEIAENNIAEFSSVPAGKTKTTVAEIAQQNKQNSQAPQAAQSVQTTQTQPAQPIQINQVANLDSVIQQNNNFKQQTSKRLDNLEQEYKKLGAKIDQNQKSLQAISNNLMQLVSKRSQGDSFNQYWVQIQDAIKKHGRNLLVSIGLFVMMIITFVYFSRAKRNIPEPIPTQENVNEVRKVKEDYDYVPVESIASKLDLARAYIDMDDHEEARSALEEVLNNGTDQQKRDALELMAKLNK